MSKKEMEIGGRGKEGKEWKGEKEKEKEYIG
jgi:hypothetical protein